MFFFIASGWKIVIAGWYVIHAASVYSHVCCDVFLDPETTKEKGKKNARFCCPGLKRTIGS